MTDPVTDAVLGELLGSAVVERRRAHGGYAAAERWIVRFADGRSAFVKEAPNDQAAGWLRREHEMYEALRAPFMARLLAWADGERPVLVLEDLSHAAWPPPWSEDRIAAVLATFDAVAATPPPAFLPRLAESGVAGGWATVARDPAPLLATGAVGAPWLERALPDLVAAAAAFPLDGTALLHFDVRSDNLCLRDDGTVVLVDWNLAHVGNPRLDVAFWLPSLRLEGGPPPGSILRDAGREAAVVAGFFAARAGLPPVPEAPTVRDFQLAQLRVALPWACEALGIEPPSG